jgi:hypothetical protein
MGPRMSVSSRTVTHTRGRGRTTGVWCWLLVWSKGGVGRKGDRRGMARQLPRRGTRLAGCAGALALHQPLRLCLCPWYLQGPAPAARLCASRRPRVGAPPRPAQRRPQRAAGRAVRSAASAPPAAPAAAAAHGGRRRGAAAGAQRQPGQQRLHAAERQHPGQLSAGHAGQLHAAQRAGQPGRCDGAAAARRAGACGGGGGGSRRRCGARARAGRGAAPRAQPARAAHTHLEARGHAAAAPGQAGG